ncbi:MAG: Alkanesulfonates transporter ATP-binding protein / Sulfonate transporter, ATP-binding [Conexibacter sp.]|nr:Alkanesulfonates transporter ATP-binding protein / Sulfonate transporter, ATP-binding [Conexibacter sp.]
MSAVVVRGVGRSFGDRRVLRDIDLTVEAGEFLVIVGQSGCGKSTLLRALGGLDAGHVGDVAVDGRVAFGFQDARLLPWARVWQNVVFGVKGSKQELRRQAVAVLAEVGLERHADAWPATLSGGEAQRVALARALTRDPSVLLLDEPFGALDALTRLKMQSLVNGLWRERGFAVVLVTHDVEEAILLADRIAVLDRGIVADRLEVDLERPRSRTDERFEALRVRVLEDLGVSDVDATLSARDDARVPA